MKQAIAVLLAGLLLLSGCAGPSDQGAASSDVTEFEAQTWQVACSGGKDSPCGAAAAYFAQLIFEATNGAITVEVFPDDDLTGGDAAAGLAALQNGATALAFYSDGDYAALDPRFGVVSLPFLFDSPESADAALSGAGGAALGEILRSCGVQCLGIGEDGFRLPTNSVRPVAAPADLAGLRIRTGGTAILERAYTLWGAETVESVWPAVYIALRTGQCDGQETPLYVANAASIQTVQKYVTDWTGVYGCVFFCMHAALYDGLSSGVQKIVRTCGAQAAARQRELSREKNAAALQAWRRAGMEVTTLTPEQADAFRQLSASCRAEFAPVLTEELLAAFPESTAP